MAEPLSIVIIRSSNPDAAIRDLKRKMQRELIYRCMKTQRYYEPDSVKKVRKAEEAARRRSKSNRSRRYSD